MTGFDYNILLTSCVRCGRTSVATRVYTTPYRRRFYVAYIVFEFPCQMLNK